MKNRKASVFSIILALTLWHPMVAGAEQPAEIGPSGTITEAVISADIVGGNGVDNGEPDEFRIIRNDPGVDVYVDGNFSQTFIFASLISLTVNGSNDDDTLTIDFSQGNPIPAGGLLFHGEDNGSLGDTLKLTSGSFTSVSYEYFSSSDGAIELDGSTILYTGLEPIIDSVVSANLIVIGTNASNAITYAQGINNPSYGLVAVDSFETLEFINKTNLELNGLFGNDDIVINNPIVPAGLMGITVNCDNGDDVVSVLNSSTVFSIIINGNDGDDLFRVNPASATAIQANGDGHFALDTLWVDSGGAYAINTGSAVRIFGFQDVHYTGMEKVRITRDGRLR